jgi:hypothetical protein
MPESANQRDTRVRAAGTVASGDCVANKLKSVTATFIIRTDQMPVRLVLGIILGIAGFGQLKPPLGILRAELLSWDGSWDNGTLRLRLESGLDYACNFDARSFFERDRVRISPGRLRPGDRVEVMSDRTAQSSLCFARMIKVVAIHEEAAVWGSVTRATEHFAPRGTLIYSGVVVEEGTNQFLLRTRSGQRQAIRLRPDTRFVQNGRAGGREILAINAQVYVRAGLNSEEEVEAYQVISGEILQPKGPTVRQP